MVCSVIEILSCPFLVGRVLLVSLVLLEELDLPVPM